MSKTREGENEPNPRRTYDISCPTRHQPLIPLDAYLQMTMFDVAQN